MPPKQTLSPIRMPQEAPIVELDDLEADWGILDEMARPRSMVIEVPVHPCRLRGRKMSS